MKHKLLGLLSAAIMILAAALLSSVEPVSVKSTRIHQHLSSRQDTDCGCQGAELCTHLPLVVIDTMGQAIPGAPTLEKDLFGQELYTAAADGETTILSNLSVIDHESANNHPSDQPDFTTSCEIRIRGKSSRQFPKRSYALKFVDSCGEANNLSVMGMGAHHDWVLHGPILDKSLIRNYLWYNIGGEIMGYAPNVRFCEVILNGEYQGLYLMTESITDGKDCRLNLSLTVKNAESTGYLLRIDRPTEQDLGTPRDIYTYNERMSNVDFDVSIRYPGTAGLTPELAKDIELDYSAFEKALFSFDYDTEDYGYRNYIDVENFIDYFIINEFSKNYDAGNFSTYIYKEVGEKFKLCIWDFNNSCDNYSEQAFDASGFFLVRRDWYFMLFRDEAFVEQLLRRYEQLRQTYLSQEYLMSYIDDTLAYLGCAVDRNNQRWADEIAGLVEWESLMPKERNLHSHQEAVVQLKSWICARGAWLDSNIQSLRQYAHPSRNNAYNH